MGVKKENFHLVKLLGLEFLIVLIDHPCCHNATPISEREVYDFSQRKFASRISEKAFADIGNALNNTIVGLRGRGERSTRIIVDFHLAVSSFLHLSAPLFSYYAALVRSRPEVRELQGHDLLLCVHL
ncbi:MAG: hypothetical protein A4E57_04775 [Syntrophorhabdaceae bacterium PtaU1.Bin034]|nr:MAG: hypothetical protein A4E57_04775 [Syntrophorhabdaceae bacterium PtaU1.Bin034]